MKSWKEGHSKIQLAWIELELIGLRSKCLSWLEERKECLDKIQLNHFKPEDKFWELADIATLKPADGSKLRVVDVVKLELRLRKESGVAQENLTWNTLHQWMVKVMFEDVFREDNGDQ